MEGLASLQTEINLDLQKKVDALAARRAAVDAKRRSWEEEKAVDYLQIVERNYPTSTCMVAPFPVCTLLRSMPSNRCLPLESRCR